MYPAERRTQKENFAEAGVAGAGVFTVVWMFLGIAAFVASIVCMGRGGSGGAKLGGFLLAILFGPFYWIFYFASDEYCKATTPTQGGGCKSSVQRRVLKK